MRADRLISLLMILQERGRVRGEDLAAELEVSVRTIYRDLDALGMAGIPVYAERGVGGGCALLEEYRASLSALTEAEVRSLFLLSIPEPLAALGLGDTLKAAYTKLSAAFPGLLARQSPAQPRVYLDWAGWRHLQAGPYLPQVYRAVCENRRLVVRYTLRNRIRVEQRVDPYGLVAKAGDWYLIFAVSGKLDWRLVTRLEDVTLTGETFELLPGFNLEAFWKSACARVEKDALPYCARVRAQPAVVPYLLAQPWVNAANCDPGHPGPQELELEFESLYDARRHILGLGRAVEVLEPEPLRRSVLDFAEQIVGLYRGNAVRGGSY